MAAKSRGQTPDLTEQLLKDGSRFPFIQAVRLLRLFMRNKAGGNLDEQEINQHIRVRPKLSLDFPGTDITSIDEDPDKPDRFLLTVSFLGLYGSSSPLPVFYTEDLFEEWREGKSLCRDFLDIINSPLYSLFFRIWSKYQLFYKVAEEGDSKAIQRLYSLLGLENESCQKQFKDTHRLLRYAGLTTQSPRSAAGLRMLLADRLGEPTVKIIQCVPRTVTIPQSQRFSLGIFGNRLGENCFMGTEMVDRMGKFQVRLGPVDVDTFHRFLPDQDSFDEIKEMIRFYLDQPLLWELVVLIRTEEIQPAQLGTSRWSQLGWDTWSFSGKPPAGTTKIRLSA